MADVTETRQGPEQSSGSRAVVGVVVVFSEESSPAEPRTLAVTARRRVGRDEGAAWQLHDSQMSREHAELAPARGGVTVTDLGSRNGTFVDERRVTEPCTFAAVGSCIRLGKTLLMVVDDVELFRQNPPCSRPPLVGGARMAEVARAVATVAPFAHPVLVLGETGTGKERVAEAVHSASGRVGPFVPVNSSAIPTDLVESELFGHARGAFSGSHQARTGLFRSAQGGTLFLDEIADLPLAAQAKLLRVLETGEVRGVGEDRAGIVDVRVVSATNADLDALAESGRFRPDLLHRISTWRIALPTLRDRAEDVPLLAAHFLPPGGAGFSVEAMARLVLWRWPGNVRELRAAVLTSAARGAAEGASQILVAHLPSAVATGGARPAAQSPAQGEDAVFRAKVVTALALREGNVAQVARDLGCGRPWLYQEIKRLGIDVSAHRKR
ncbi:MAG: sigma 54-interacting transcriptional regulator [Polyangiaceae bacterium]|nr:sigma 54-interacting transcriptional regulator [Polyangiaceae bacterium]